jgi:DNA-binding response OmpR family regulator
MWIRPENSVLLVEPDTFVRRYLVSALQQAGYRVLSASDGAEALHLVRQYPRLRLVISEVLLPNTPAITFLRDLRRLRRDLPVIFTSSIDPRLLTQPLPQRDILAKPFSPDILVERVGRQLRGQGPKVKLGPPRQAPLRGPFAPAQIASPAVPGRIAPSHQPVDQGRFAWLGKQFHVRFFGRSIIFQPIASSAGTNAIFPSVLAAAAARVNMVNRIAITSTILASATVAQKDILARQRHFFERPTDVVEHANHGRKSNAA